MSTVSHPDLLENPSLLDPLLATDAWHTLMTFTREHGKYLLSTPVSYCTDVPFRFPIAPSRPSSSAPGTSTGMDQDIPQEVFDQIAAEEAARLGTSTPGGAGGIRICPHCTFENDHGGSDCEVCGLPL